MQVKMRGRVRNVTEKVGRTLILLGKAEEYRKPKRAYKRRDMTAETIPEPVIVEDQKDSDE